jgi:hypothetical protein
MTILWYIYKTFCSLLTEFIYFPALFGQNSTNFMQFNNYKPVSLLYSKGVPLYEVSGMFKGWRS